MIKELIPEVRNNYYDSIFSCKKHTWKINLSTKTELSTYYIPTLNIGNMRSQSLIS